MQVGPLWVSPTHSPVIAHKNRLVIVVKVKVILEEGGTVNDQTGLSDMQSSLKYLKSLKGLFFF